LNFLKDGNLVEVGGDGDLVVARNKEEVGDGKITNVGIIDKAGKGGVALGWRVSTEKNSLNIQEELMLPNLQYRE
jgi:hypothetical protein